MSNYTTLDKLVRAFAPKPKLFLFVNIAGLALDVQRDPHTMQPLVGMSRDLARRIERKLLEEQNENFNDRFESVQHLRSSSLDLVFRPAISATWLETDVPDFSALPEYIRVTIAPQPVALR
jgi:hypothetical protein